MIKLYDQVRQRARDAFPFVVEARRALHRIPETGFQEKKTAAFVEEQLWKLGFEPQCHIAGTGLTARLAFKNPGPALMIRADMDALPVREETGLDFASLHEGYMHACGHDGHMAMLLGTARVLGELSQAPQGADLKGSVLFLFQPAEESLGGAVPMIESGVLRGVDYCLAAHIWPGIPEGTIGVRQGFAMAAMDGFKITLKGRGGHGSQPHFCTDVVDTAAQMVCALQHVVSRLVNPVLPAVLTVGSIQAGDTFNVLPDTARILGSARCFHPEVRAGWEEHISRVARGICQSKNVEFKLTFFRGDGPVNNDPEVAAVVAGAAAMALGEGSVMEPELSLAGEDFSRYQEVVPGCMFFVGAGREGARPLHSPEFSFSEDILLNGVTAFCASALALLNRQG